jgi:hypothetical protein
MIRHISREERLSRQGANTNRGQVWASQAQGEGVRRPGTAEPPAAVRLGVNRGQSGMISRRIAGTVSAGNADVFPILGKPRDVAGV